MARWTYRGLVMAAAVAVAAFVAGAAWVYREAWPYRELQGLLAESPTLESSRTVATDLATLEVRIFRVPLAAPIQPWGGGIEVVGEKVLVMSYRGEFFLYDPQQAASNRLASVDIQIDNGYDAFQAFMKERHPNVSDTNFFRFIDILHGRSEEGDFLIASHHQWNDAQACYTLRLSRLTLPREVSLESLHVGPEGWVTLYDTTPCLAVDSAVPYFTGDQSGGRMVKLDPGTILWSVGDHAFDGWTSKEALPQATGKDYGKVLRVQLDPVAVEHFTIGHRNPQGLMIDAEGRIWETEHGPRGGDELNLLRTERNYGWPLATYGAQYGMTHWPPSESLDKHEGFTRPVYAWMPSIGASNLIEVRGFHPVWDGDLLVASMRDLALHRLRYQDERVIYDERIELGVRIRDLHQLSDGTIVIWTDQADLIEIAPGMSRKPDVSVVVADLPEQKRDQARGVLTGCLQCHRAAQGEAIAIGPNLWGVYGRKIGSTNFSEYSQALRSRSGVWDEANLDQFLKDVKGFAGDTTMQFSGVADEDVRRAVIAYLKQLN
jgi:cytochrome c2